MQKSVEKIFVELIQQSLNLPANYGTDADGNVIPCVTIRAQNIKLFNTPHLQITVQTVSNQIFANRKEYFEETIDDVTTYYERQMINEQRTMQIDVYSRNNEARERFWEVQAALGSTLAEQLANKYQFRIGKISSSTNTSGLEGGSDINRFSIRFNCLTWQEKVTPVNYYNSFQTKAQTENNIFDNFKIENNEIIQILPEIVWTQNFFSLVNYSNVRSGEYEQWQGGFYNYTNFTDNEGGFLTYKLIKDSYTY